MRKFFLVFLAIGTIIYSSQKLKIPLPKIINNYVNDFLFVPIVLFICLFVIRKLRNDNQYKISVLLILYLCLVYSVFFEYYLPKYYTRYTSDCIDVILYFIGGFTFWSIQNKYKDW